MQRLSCENYPCHFPDQDCALCFCPFYPCLNSRTGGYEENGAWCCKNCTLIHLPEVSNMVRDALMNGLALTEVWSLLEEML